MYPNIAKMVSGDALHSAKKPHIQSQLNELPGDYSQKSFQFGDVFRIRTITNGLETINFWMCIYTGHIVLDCSNSASGPLTETISIGRMVLSNEGYHRIRYATLPSRRPIFAQ